MWIRWCGECLWLSPNKPQFILGMIVWIIYIQSNQPHRTVKQLFDGTRKLVREKTEIRGISLIYWHENSRKRTTLLTDQAVRLSTAKAYVFSDSVLCMGRISESPVSAWKEKVDRFMNSSHCRELDRIDGEPMEFEWKTFPSTTLGILGEIQKMMTEIQCELETDYLHVNVQRHCMETGRKRSIV